MRFDAFERRAAQVRADCLVVGVFERGEIGTITATVNTALNGRLLQWLRRGDFSGRAGESALVPECPGVAAGRLLLVGLGARASFNRRAWRKSVQAAVSALTRTRVGSVAFALERAASGELDDYYVGRAVAEICASTLYRINDLKSARRAPAPALARLGVGPVASAALPHVRRGLAAG